MTSLHCLAHTRPLIKLTFIQKQCHKLIRLSTRNLVSNVLQIFPVEGKYLLPEHSRSGKRGVLLCPLPFFHIYGKCTVLQPKPQYRKCAGYFIDAVFVQQLSNPTPLPPLSVTFIAYRMETQPITYTGMVAGMLLSLHTGAKLVFMTAFELKQYLKLIQDHQVTRGPVVPPIVLALAKHPLVDSFRLESLEALICAAAPLGAEVQTQAALRLKCLVKQAWGMTELSPLGTMVPDDFQGDITRSMGTSGFLLPGTEGKIVHPETGKDQESTSEGELLLRGPQVMLGYLHNKEATNATIRPDGWMHTGDIAKFSPDGLLQITDRSKELIKYKGFQVPPAELEALLLTMPQIKDCVVIPVPDEEAGEIPRAYVVLQDALIGTPAQAAFTSEVVCEYVAARVAPYKKLRGGVRFATSIPKSPSGKLLRRVQVQMDRAATVAAAAASTTR